MRKILSSVLKSVRIWSFIPLGRYSTDSPGCHDNCQYLPFLSAFLYSFFEAITNCIKMNTTYKKFFFNEENKFIDGFH